MSTGAPEPPWHGGPDDREPVAPVHGENDPTATTPAFPRASLHIDDFRIVRQLGAGGMGLVYEAEQQNPKRAVALKVIRGGAYVDDTRLRMFRREVQTLARLKHPGIAAIYESGRTPDGQHFFAMELVRGETLGEHLKRRSDDAALSPAEVEERLALFRKICDAISYAHQRGVIHRDLKPANIQVLREAPAAGSATGGLASVPDVKILDFGLARITDNDVAVSTVLTDLGSVQGTLPYMSPEQVRGNADEIDLRTDVYSLGVILYEMLSGRLPLDVQRTQLPETLRVICEEPPQPLSQTWKGSRRLDPDLATIVHKAMEKEPARRYQSASALAEDLQRYVTDQPILARPPSTAYQLRKLVARHKAAFSFVVALFVLLAGFSVTMTIQAGRIARERDRANREAETASQVSDFLVGLFKVSDPSKARGNSVTAREILDQGAQSIDRELQGEPLVQAKLLSAMGRVYQSLGLYGRAEPLLRRALEIRRRAKGEQSLQYAESLHDLGYVYFRIGDFERAQPLHEEGFRIREKLLPAGDPKLAESYYHLGRFYVWSGRIAAGIPYLEHALAIFEKSPADHSIEMSWCLNDLGSAWQEQRDYARAGPALERALQLKERVLPPDHPDVALALNNWGYLLTEAGDYGKARPLLERALALQQKNYGLEHAGTALVMQSLGEMWWRARDAAKARPLLEGALAIQQQVLAPDHPDIALSQLTLAFVLRDTGRYAEAEPLFQRALAIREKVLPSGHADIAQTLEGYATLLRLMHRPEAAAGLEARAESIRHYARSDSPP